MEDNVILYTIHCPKCNVLQKKLELKNVNYSIVDDTAVMEEKGFTSSPMLEVNGKVMDFGQANLWVNSIKK